MLVTGQGPQCMWALEGVRAGHLFQVVPLTWSLDTRGGARGVPLGFTQSSFRFDYFTY